MKVRGWGSGFGVLVAGSAFFSRMFMACSRGLSIGLGEFPGSA